MKTSYLKNEKSEHNYFPALTGLRVVAASMVFVYHFSGLGNHNLSFAQIFLVLRYRMTIFFVLSGFVIMLSLLPQQQLTIKEYANFVIKKLIRLFPLYLFLLIVPYLHVGIPSLPVFITNITLTKGFFEELFFSGIGPAWSLTTEITFYCVAPFILSYMQSKAQILLSYLGILTIGLLLLLTGYFLTYIGKNPYGFFSDIYFTLNITFFGRATDFYIGILLAWLIYYYPEKALPNLVNLKKTYLGIFLILIISFFIYYFDNLLIYMGPVLALICLHLLLPVAVGVFLYGLVKEKTLISSFLSLKWMIWLGNSSYGFYLMHTGWVQYKISKINPLPDHGYVFLWIIALLSYYYFEKPLTIFLRKTLIIILSVRIRF